MISLNFVQARPQLIALFQAVDPDSRQLGYTLASTLPEAAQFELAAGLLFDIYQKRDLWFDMGASATCCFVSEWPIAKALHSNFAMPNFLATILLSSDANDPFCFSPQGFAWETMIYFTVDELAFQPQYFQYALPYLAAMPPDYAFWFCLSIGFFDAGSKQYFALQNAYSPDFIEQAFAFSPQRANRFIESIIQYHIQHRFGRGLELDKIAYFIDYLRHFQLFPALEAELLYLQGQKSAALACWEQQLLSPHCFQQVAEARPHLRYFQWQYEGLTGQEPAWEQLLTHYFGTAEAIAHVDDLRAFYRAETHKYYFAAECMRGLGLQTKEAEYEAKAAACQQETLEFEHYLQLLCSEQPDTIMVALALWAHQPAAWREQLWPALVMFECLYYRTLPALAQQASELVPNTATANELRQCFAPVAYAYLSNIAALELGFDWLDLKINQYYDGLFNFNIQKVEAVHLEKLLPFWDKMEGQGSWFYFYLSPVYDALGLHVAAQESKYRWSKLLEYRPILRYLVLGHFYLDWQRSEILSALQRLDADVDIQARLLYEMGKKEKAIALVEQQLAPIKWFTDYFIWKFQSLEILYPNDAAAVEKDWIKQIVLHCEAYHGYEDAIWLHSSLFEKLIGLCKKMNRLDLAQRYELAKCQPQKS